MYRALIILFSSQNIQQLKIKPDALEVLFCKFYRFLQICDESKW